MPLDDFIAKDQSLKDKFLPSVFNTAVVDGKPYGVPMRGTQPVMMFHNKKVLADAGITPPKTWDELLAAVKTLKGKGVTPIALGGGDKWPTQMWYQYVYDRVAGPELFQKAMTGDKSAWESAESKKALSMIKELVDAGAFGTNFDSVKFTDGGSPALLATGKAAFELMGSWEYSTLQDAHPDFAQSDLGYGTFPTISGGKGDPSNLAGNTNNYYSVLKKTKHPEAVADFLKLMYSDEFVKAQLSIGNLPTTTNTARLPRHLGEPGVLEVPVRPGGEGPGVPALLGPGVPARGDDHDPRGRPAVLQRPDRRGRLHQADAVPAGRLTPPLIRIR